MGEKFGNVIRDVDLVSAAMYPAVFNEFMNYKEKYGDVSVIPTRLFLSPLKIGEECTIKIEEGKSLIIKLLAVG